MWKIQSKPDPITSSEQDGFRNVRRKSAGASVVELGVGIKAAEDRRPIGLCSLCFGYRSPRFSTAQYPHVFCSDRCEQEFVRTALASVTLDDCVRMHRKLEALVQGGDEREC